MVGTRRRPPHGLLIFMDKDVFDMTLIERMVAAGMSRDCAAETAMWYMAQGDDEGLEDYVTAVAGNTTTMAVMHRALR